MNLLPHILELSIIDKRTNRVVSLADYIKWPQRLLVDTVSRNLTNGDQTRIIILKARQLGFSTITEGIQFSLAMMVDNFSGLVVTHNNKGNTHLLGMTQRYFNHYPYRRAFNQTGRAHNRLKWEPITNATPSASTINVVTAKSLDDGRGQTVQFLHGSEVAFWPDAGTLMASLGPAIPKSPFSFVILESTANGIGNYFETTWNDAVANINDYIPIFIPWQVDPEYRAERIGKGIPFRDPSERAYDEEEERLRTQFRKSRLDEECQVVLSRTLPAKRVAELSQPMTDDEINSRLAWREYILYNELAKRKDGTNPFDLFLQEYPDCPRVAFLSTGTNIFPLPFLNKIYRPMKGTRGDILKDGGRHRFVDMPQGPLTIFRTPSDTEQYIVAGDPTFTVGGDYGCIQVINRRTWEQVAVYRAKVDPGAFGDKMCEIGWYYNQALLVPEVNNDGAVAIGRIIGRDYPNVWQRQASDQEANYSGNKMGWFTSTRTKHEAVGNLKTCVFDQSVTIHHPHTFSEMKNYVDLGLGKYGNANGEPNDDTVMALAIGVTVNAYEADEMVAHDNAVRSQMTEMSAQLNEISEMVVGSRREGVAVSGAPSRGGFDSDDF